jgi:hypothetical protein
MKEEPIGEIVIYRTKDINNAISHRRCKTHIQRYSSCPEIPDSSIVAKFATVGTFDEKQGAENE